MKRSHLKYILPALSIIALGTWESAMKPSTAVAASANLNVTATVVDECTMAGANLAFGNYSGAQAVTANALIDVTCQDINTQWSIVPDAGLNPNGCIRRMQHDTDPNSFLIYLLQDQNAAELGSGDLQTCPGSVLSGTGSDPDPSIFGEISAGQTALVGQYSDTVTMTITIQ